MSGTRCGLRRRAPLTNGTRCPTSHARRTEMEYLSNDVLRPLWEYLAVSETPRPADVIFVFGSGDLRVPTRAAELFRQGYAPRALVTGSFGPMTRHVFPKPEADVFADCLVAQGVPRAAIVTEDEATNTLENVRLGMSALRAAGVHPRTALLVAKEFVMRRCVATFEKQYPEVQVTPCPPTGGMAEARDRSPVAFATRLVAEIDRLDRYGGRGDIRPQTVGPSVRDAAQAIDTGLGGGGRYRRPLN